MSFDPLKNAIATDQRIAKLEARVHKSENRIQLLEEKLGRLDAYFMSHIHKPLHGQERTTTPILSTEAD